VGTIAFLTDFGRDDVFVGVCHGVMVAIAPRSRVVDITHSVPRQDVRAGSIQLARAAAYFPGAVGVAVVDPGVGTARRALAVATARMIFVGPDNGLLPPAIAVTGGAIAAVELLEPKYFRHPVSSTFHARDIFCPVAAHLSRGVDMADLGPALDCTTLVALPEPKVELAPGKVTAEVLFVDIYGNVHSAAPGDAVRDWGLGTAVTVQVGRREAHAVVATAFGQVAPGRLVVYEDSSGGLSIAVNAGNAAVQLGLAASDVVTVAAGWAA